MRSVFWNFVSFEVQMEITLLYPGMEMFLFSPGLLLVYMTVVPIRNGWILQDALLLPGDFLKKINSDYDMNGILNSQAPVVASESPGRLVNTQMSGPPPLRFCSVSLWWGQRIYISDKFPGYADAAGPGTTFLRITAQGSAVYLPKVLPKHGPCFYRPMSKVWVLFILFLPMPMHSAMLIGLTQYLLEKKRMLLR